MQWPIEELKMLILRHRLALVAALLRYVSFAIALSRKTSTDSNFSMMRGFQM
jgi:hypothetical protein